jgi:DNA-directed RNA polymerase subunit RPC12/RpoP
VAYRSGAERRFAEDLERRGIKFEYEKEKWPYLSRVRGGLCSDCGSKFVYKNRYYVPDFYIVDLDFYVEIKGRLTSKDRTKYKDVVLHNNERDLRFIILANNKLSKQSTTRYGDWMESEGLVYAIGGILPTSWERPNGKRST